MLYQMKELLTNIWVDVALFTPISNPFRRATGREITSVQCHSTNLAGNGSRAYCAGHCTASHYTPDENDRLSHLIPRGDNISINQRLEQHAVISVALCNYA